MSAAIEITETLVRDHLNRAICDSFTSLLGRTPALVRVAEMCRRNDLSPPPISPANGRTSLLVGTVGLLGDVKGLVYLYLDETFARLVTRRLLGRSETGLVDPGDEAVNRAIGNVTHLAAGHLRNSLRACGYPCTITPPSILRGRKFAIEPVGKTIRYLYKIEPTAHMVAVDLLLVAGD